MNDRELLRFPRYLRIPGG